jgi:hypothetical protein
MPSTAASGAATAGRSSEVAAVSTTVNAPTSVSTTSARTTRTMAPGGPPPGSGRPMSRATCEPELVKMLEKIEKNVAGMKQRVIRMSRATSPP